MYADSNIVDRQGANIGTYDEIVFVNLVMENVLKNTIVVGDVNWKQTKENCGEKLKKTVEVSSC